MSVNSDDFLSFAEDCLINRTDEIGYRNCIARAYYSCYHKLKPLLKNAPKGHLDFIDYLCKANKSYNENFEHSDLRKWGLVLDSERKKRVHADYYLNKRFDKIDAELSITIARKLKLEIDSASNNSQLST